MLSQFFLSLLAFSFIAGQLIRLDIFGVQFPLLDASVFLFVAYHILSKQFSWKKYLEQKWLLIFIGALIVSNIINSSRYPLADNVTGNLYLLRFMAYSMLIGIQLDGQKKASVHTERIINGIGIVITLIGIFQFIFLPDLRFLQYQNWDDHLGRLTFPYLDPSFTGAILLIFLLINILGRNSPWRTTTIIIELIAIILTFSRATWAAGGIIFLMIIWRRRKMWKVREMLAIGGIICMIVMVTISFEKSRSYGNRFLRTETISSRTSSWQKGLQIWQKNPIFGVGFNNYKTYQIKNGYYVKNNLENRGEASVENSYIFVLATSGIVGLAAFSLWMLGVLSELNGLSRCIFVSILIGSLFNNIFFYPFIILIIFTILNSFTKLHRDFLFSSVARLIGRHKF